MAKQEIEQSENHFFSHTEDNNMGIGSLEISIPGVIAYYDKKGELQSNLEEKTLAVAEEINKRPEYGELFEDIRTGKAKGHYGAILGGLGLTIIAGLIGLEAKRGWRDLKHLFDLVEPYLKPKNPHQD